MKYVLTIVILLAVFVGGALLYAWSGIYNIAATEPHFSVTKSFIDTLKDRSIEAHSDDVRVPNLEDSKLKGAAFSHYHAMCRLCHGAPGYPPEEFAQGLYPNPPIMTSGHPQKEFSDAEIYWIAKHGIKLTGMPAFGPTHSEEELWGLVNLVKEIPQMNAEQYKQMVQATQSEGEMGRGHGHGHGEAEGQKEPGHGHQEGASSGEAKQEHNKKE